MLKSSPSLVLSVFGKNFKTDAKIHAIIFILISIIRATNSGNNQYGKRLGLYCLYAQDQCPNERITFWLYKNFSAETVNSGPSPPPLRIDPLNLQNQDFEPHRPLKILIHGYAGNRYRTPNHEIRSILLQTQPVHVLSVDFESLVRFPCYNPWALQNVPIIAKCLGQLLNNLLTPNGVYAPNEIHLIGFSLGGQIAGLTANWLDHKLHRITALDPAGPGFSTRSNVDRLDPSDADFVDAIHTDITFKGIVGPSGHADFYPNAGYVDQNGCDRFIATISTHICNHFRSALYYAESIVTPSGFWSYPCESPAEFLQLKCNKFSAQQHAALMGYFVAENASGAYYLTTNANAPFARGRLYLEGIE